MSELKAAAMTTADETTATAETEETTAMAKAGGGILDTAMDSHGRRRGGDGGVKGWQRGLFSIVGMYCSFHVEPRSFLNVQKTTSIYTNKK